MNYLLVALFLILSFYLFTYILNEEKMIEKEISSILENRLKYAENEYRRSQEQLFKLKFKEWLNENEFEIRRTAIQQMSPQILDNISNELSIVRNNFAFNPRDIKFVGRFIDLVVFDGAANEELINIYFIDLQRSETRSKHNFRAKVAKAIQEGNVFFQEINL